MAIKITREEFTQKFGQGIKPPESKDGLGGTISSAFKSGVSQAQEGYQQAKQATNPLQLLEGGTKLAAGAINTAFSPLAPVTKPIGQVIDYTGGKIGNISAVQKFAQTKMGENVARGAEDIGNLSTIAGTVAGFKSGPKLTSMAEDVSANVGQKANKIAQNVKTFSSDVIPSSERIVNTQVTKALDLTQGDVKNISQSTGHEVGQFLAENNLIKENKISTQQAVKDFYQQNYDAVRNEIGKVQKTYKPYQVPRYVETLKEINKKISNTPGLQKVSVEVENLLKKPDIELLDVQRVKELLDEHFNLYKKTGDVGEGVSKAGLDNLRKDIKSFIEKEVKDSTGSDIRKLNNNVATAKGISNAIEERSTAGLTRSNLKIGDLGIFGVGMSMGGPLGGVAAIFAKKLVESPAVQLRIAKYMDSISDTRKAAIAEDLQSGKIPPELKQFIKIKR
jgi:hypothetical protein